MAEKTNLTDRLLASLRKKPAEPGKRYEVMDTTVPGMGVRVTDKGKVTFIYVARYPGSPNPTRRALGEYGAITLEQAREKARDWRELIDRGIDPAKQLADEIDARQRTEAAKSDRTFEKVLGRFIKARKRDKIRKADEDERDFERECTPLWKGRPVDEIRMADILEVVEGIANRGKTRQALNMGQKIGTFFNWCVDAEIVEVSPYRPKRVRTAVGERATRERVLSDAEIGAFWKATDQLAPVYRDVYRVLMLTGQRLNDIARASWSEIDLEQRTLTIPADRFKSAREHVVPLTDDVIEILEALPRFKKCDWVFSLDGKAPATIGHKVKQRLDAAMLEVLNEDSGNDAEIAAWVNHDLRRTVRTRLSDLDVFDEVAELVIGHAPTALNRTYNKSQRLAVKLDALNRWQGALRPLTGRARADNVVPMVRAAE